MARRRSDFLVSRIPLSAACKTSPRESNFNSFTLACREHSGFPTSQRVPRVPAGSSASCSRGAVTSQIPACLFIPFCSGSEIFSAGVYSSAGRVGPRDARLPGWRLRVAAGGRRVLPGGQCRPRAALRRAPRDPRRAPRPLAECYPVLNVTLTHSIPDTTALTSSIHAARAPIGQASRPGWAVLPLRPFISSGREPRRGKSARGAGSAD